MKSIRKKVAFVPRFCSECGGRITKMRATDLERTWKRPLSTCGLPCEMRHMNRLAAVTAEAATDPRALR